MRTDRLEARPLPTLRWAADEIERLRKRRVIPGDCPKIVCLCGSTRFMDAFHEAGWQLTLDGDIVLSVGVCKHAEHHTATTVCVFGAEVLGPDVAERLDELHLRKIDLAEWVFILNVGGYVGESTRREVDYARQQGKVVTFLEPNAKGVSDAPS